MPSAQQRPAENPTDVAAPPIILESMESAGSVEKRAIRKLIAILKPKTKIRRMKTRREMD